jgi:hypothetical protein
MWLALLLIPITAFSFVSGPKQHPIDMMHSLPRGEAPGWSGNFWVESETNIANVWNKPLTIQRKSNGEFLNYVADYEQVAEMLSVGWAVFEDVSVGFETTYVSRNGGFLDHMIDETHKALHMGRFDRTSFPEYQSHMEASTSKSTYSHNEAYGFTNYVAKGKWWLYRFRSRDPYDGIALGVRYKMPASDGANGLSSGDRDISGTFDLGVPLIERSTINLSFAYTRMGDNLFFRDWPRNEWTFMYNLALRVDVGRDWILLGSLSSQTPLLDVSQIDYVPPTGVANIGSAYRSDPGWKGLTEWRTQETLGAQKILDEWNHLSFYFTEDWDMGDRDIIGDWLSINGAPDISIGANFIHYFSF